jgi:hypothetical protein
VAKPITLRDRLLQWERTYAIVRRAVTPDEFRGILAAMSTVEGVAQLSSYMRLAESVMANDRSAAETAGKLVWGVEPPTEEDILQWTLEEAPVDEPSK